MLAYMSNVISSEFVIGCDGEFANNTLVTINLVRWRHPLKRPVIGAIDHLLIYAN